MGTKRLPAVRCHATRDSDRPVTGNFAVGNYVVKKFRHEEILP